MPRELGFAIINPYTIAKSRTGGVIGRLLSRTGLNLAAARMFGPSEELVHRYADSLEKADDREPEICRMLAQYVRLNYAPDPVTGRRRRVIFLLLEGENAIQRIRDATGHVKSCWLGGETIRDTYGDLITDENGQVKYFEPAILVAPSVERSAAVCRLWAEYSERDGGIIEEAVDVPETEGVQKTLVLLKPENFRMPTARPGHIIDLLSRSGLRIIGLRRIQMTVAQAEEFYGPVVAPLEERFRSVAGIQAGEFLEKGLDLELPEELKAAIGHQLAPLLARRQFERIVEFMTGFKPSALAESEKQKAGSESCLALIYKGMSAVQKIRYLLGATDPAKAEPGSVRREFGSDVMKNAAHASDSPENAIREINIVKVEEDNIREWVDRYYGT